MLSDGRLSVTINSSLLLVSRQIRLFTLYNNFPWVFLYSGRNMIRDSSVCSHNSPRNSVAIRVNQIWTTTIKTIFLADCKLRTCSSTVGGENIHLWTATMLSSCSLIMPFFAIQCSAVLIAAGIVWTEVLNFAVATIARFLNAFFWAIGSHFFLWKKRFSKALSCKPEIDLLRTIESPILSSND